MTQSTETVSQRSREAAESHYPKHLWKDAARDDLAQAFARFERELSTNKDETIAKLREALDQIDNLCPATCDMTLAHEMADIARNALTSIKKEG